MAETMNAAEVEAALAKMTQEQRDHLRFVIGELIQCYLEEDKHGLLLMTGDKDPNLTLIAINATDMEAAHLLGSADTFLNFRLLDDAPPKGMMN